MSTPQHTPGPWGIIDKGEATPNTHSVGSKDHKVCTVESYPSRTTGLADAHLIAAAPELLEACTRAQKAIQKVASITDNNRLAWALEVLQSAIAKAKGE